MLAFFLKSWGKWLLIGAAILGLLWAVDHYRGAANLANTKLGEVTTENSRMIEERKVLVENQVKWDAALKKIDALSRETATARSVENQRLNAIAADVAAAKEGIKHAPGADDRFVFSDPAYGLMRPPPGEGGASDSGQGAAKGAPVVGRP
jgi:hypothetical protein